MPHRLNRQTHPLRSTHPRPPPDLCSPPSGSSEIHSPGHRSPLTYKSPDCLLSTDSPSGSTPLTQIRHSLSNCTYKTPIPHCRSDCRPIPHCLPRISLPESCPHWPPLPGLLLNCNCRIPLRTAPQD